MLNLISSSVCTDRGVSMNISLNFSASRKNPFSLYMSEESSQSTDDSGSSSNMPDISPSPEDIR